MSTVLAENRIHLAPERYLVAERQAATRSEYFNGEVYAMAGASREHNQITFNIAGGGCTLNYVDALVSPTSTTCG